MSLIEEALRRVQDPLLPAPGATAPSPKKQAAAPTPNAAKVHSWASAPPAAPGRHAASPRPVNVLVTVALAVLALTVALIAGGAFWLGRTLNGAPASHPRAGVAANAAQPRGATPWHFGSKTAASHTADTEPATPEPAKEELVLSGIVEGLGEPYAVINGIIVGVGERVGELTLLEIAKGSVRLRRPDGSETVLRLPLR